MFAQYLEKRERGLSSLKNSDQRLCMCLKGSHGFQGKSREVQHFV